ncbi:hypothetical protein BC827DRAFT_1154181 [Russula dissimulans]|nr:hypothetical protein BC827DRAFT_1154181 [Russula dissimulans]
MSSVPSHAASTPGATAPTPSSGSQIQHPVLISSVPPLLWTEGIGSAAVLQWQTTVVGGARKRARIPYPQGERFHAGETLILWADYMYSAYADKTEQEASKEAMVFNCAQRAHQNTLENVPVIVLTTLIGGLHYPIPAAAGCALWSLARIIYTVCYTTGEPRKRSVPARLGFVLQTVQFFLSGKVVFDLIKATSHILVACATDEVIT